MASNLFLRKCFFVEFHRDLLSCEPPDATGVETRPVRFRLSDCTRSGSRTAFDLIRVRAIQKN
jgi:hypothetical protein